VRADLRRRSVLAAATAAVPVLAAGCKGVGGLGTLPQPRPDVAVLRAAISDEQALIARYRSALAAGPALKDVLDPVLSQHLAHLAALRSRLIGATATAHPAQPSPAATGGVADPASTLTALASAEQAAAGRLVARLSVASPSLAQLLASISASEASHAALLRMHRSPS
jgi:ferritin-like protein